jgi:TonB family protein
MKHKKTLKQIGSIAAFLFVCMAFKPLAAQENTKDTTILNKEDVLVMPEVMPEYSGGDGARIRFLQENLKYPMEARKAGLEGRVVVGFVVEPDGRLSNFEIVQSVAPILDKEALRVVQLMPKWKPGKLHGKPVRVQYQLPITFRLN